MKPSTRLLSCLSSILAAALVAACGGGGGGGAPGGAGAGNPGAEASGVLPGVVDVLQGTGGTVAIEPGAAASDAGAGAGTQAGSGAGTGGTNGSGATAGAGSTSGAAAGTGAGGTTPAAVALTRSLTDRADDLNGPQVHVVYAVPWDGLDRSWDLTDKIPLSVAAVNNWMAQRTGRRVIFDTFGGRLDIQFVRLPRTTAEYHARGIWMRDAIEADMRAAGLLNPAKMYLAYYDGTNSAACGGAPYIPNNRGTSNERVSVLYLRAHVPGYAPCSETTATSPTQVPTWLDYNVIHEIVHMLGFPDHVTDDRCDLMFAEGTYDWECPTGKYIDRDHQQYYNPAGFGDTRFNFASSPFLTPAP